MAGNQRVAPVPAVVDRVMTGGEGDFAHLNKQLRACYVCKLIKTGPQVGCLHRMVCLQLQTPRSLVAQL